jgi:hypothetical protein
MTYLLTVPRSLPPLALAQSLQWLEYGLDDGGVWIWLLAETGIILFSESYSASRLIGTGVRGLELTTHLRLVPRLRLRGAIPPLTQMPSSYVRDHFTSVGFRKPVGLYTTEGEGQIGRSSKERKRK